MTDTIALSICRFKSQVCVP